ncbi:sulfite exporter TauE/SafE family protein [Planctomycetota bacterium]
MVGLTAGFIGGLLGVGGSIIIIPALILYLSHSSAGYTGPSQHLIQAAAMICNFFISFPAVIAHYRARAIMKPLVYRLMPAALVGICLGVALSNSSAFARENGKYLGTGLAIFLSYVVIYNIWRLRVLNHLPHFVDEPPPPATWKVICVGLPMGLVAGLLGIGGGALCVPAQQLILRIPLRRAIANSAATIMFTAVFGAIYKNATLTSHNMSFVDSLHLAVMLIPTAIVGSYLGGRLVHKLPRKILRIAFIIFMAAVAYLTFRKSLAAGPPLSGPASSPPSQSAPARF